MTIDPAADQMTLAGSAAEQVVAAFDPANNRWNLDLFGDFWNTVLNAHHAGLKGQGNRIAILDTCPDLTMGRLGDQLTLHNLGKDEPDAHGTAVALLVSQVAPQAQIDHYVVSKDAKARRSLFAQAMEKIAQNPVDYICLSLGDAQTMDPPAAPWLEPFMRRGDLLGAAREIAQRDMATPQVPVCFLNPCTCKAVEAVQSSGATILAAAGNTDGAQFCPARSLASISVGFQAVQYSYDPEQGRTRQQWIDPEGQQADYLDYTLVQPKGVIGTSFAAPLLTGALALRKGGLPLRQLLAAKEILSLTPLVDRLKARHREDPEIVRDMDYQYGAICDLAFEQTGYLFRRGLSPTQQLEAGLFLSSYAVNHGLAFFDLGDWDRAIAMFEWVREETPWVPAAHANWARCICSFVMHWRETGENRQGWATALGNARLGYEEALRIEPDNPAFLDGLENVAALRAALNLA